MHIVCTAVLYIQPAEISFWSSKGEGKFVKAGGCQSELPLLGLCL
jgi:hypothetical protein